MSKVLVLPLIAYMIAAGAWGVCDQNKQPFGEFTGKKGEAEAEALRLNEQHQAELTEETLAGVLDGEGKFVALADMRVDDLLAIASEMGITDPAGLDREQLLAAVRGDETTTPTDSAQSNAGAEPTERVYLVQRDCLMHNGQAYTFGEPIEIDSITDAQALLALSAISVIGGQA